jgi:hypothetical protein
MILSRIRKPLPHLLLSRRPIGLRSRMVSLRRRHGGGLMIEGPATLRGMGIVYRSALLPLSDLGTVVDHVLGATSYRLLCADEVPSTEVISPIP